MTTGVEHESIALKEWAVTVQALLEGDLIFVLRKGGIVEETKDFQLLSHQFYLMPAYEHQKEHLLKPHYQGRIAHTLQAWSEDQSNITLEGYAKVVEDIEITTQEQLDKIYDLHIWTQPFAVERLKWKKRNPLHLLVLRVYKLDTIQQTPMRASYTGCKSWVKIEDELAAPALEPVLSNDQFELKWSKIKDALSLK